MVDPAAEKREMPLSFARVRFLRFCKVTRTWCGYRATDLVQPVRASLERTIPPACLFAKRAADWLVQIGDAFRVPLLRYLASRKVEKVPSQATVTWKYLSTIVY